MNLYHLKNHVNFRTPKFSSEINQLESIAEMTTKTNWAARRKTSKKYKQLIKTCMAAHRAGKHRPDND